MADCSHVRCLQERRNIKRELLKWSKDMVHVVGLERIAEELMGRRKWKLFQENLSRSQTNTNPDHSNLEHKYIENLEPSIAENHITEKKEYITKNEAKDNFENDIQVKLENKITENPNSINKTIKKEINNFNSTSPLSTSLLELLEKPSIPIDWKPSDKCYFCVDGKLLTVNEKGELVAESGSALSEAELANRSTVDTDSGDSRNSTPDNSLVNVKKLIESHQHQQQHQPQQQQQQKHQQQRDSQNPPKMTSLESMAARLAAVASIHPRLPPGFGQLSQLSQLGQIYPNLYCQQLAQILPTTPTAETSLAAISPSNKNSPSPHNDAPCGGEQPLDLSAKPTLNSPSIVSGDLKQASVRPKHRINPVIANRRTYTEEELQNALQDIMSGKLGTRRAAVVYGIPRSTLRNKVYKMSSGQRRESSTPSSVNVFDADEDENDNDNDIDNDTDKTGLSDDEISNDKLLESSLLSDQEQPSRYSASLQKHRNSNNSGGGGGVGTSLNDEQNLKSSSPLDSVTTASGTIASTTSVQNKTLTPQPSQTPPITPNWMDPNIILQTLLLSGSLTGGNASAAGAIASIANLLTSTQNASPDPATMGDIINVIKLQLDELAKKFANDSNNRENLNNERALLLDSMQLTQSLKQQQQLGQLHQHHHHHQSRLPKSDTPETGSSIDMNETNEDGVILKIPSFKPVVVPASSSSTGSSIKSCDQNQISPLSTSAHHSIAPLLSRSPHQPNNLRGISPPLMRQSSESQSPPDVSIGEIIANSLNRFNQQNIKDSNLNKSHHHYNDLSEQYAKRASISVIKNIGGTDITKFAATPNLLNNYQNSVNQCAAGKGTRPKRGKYRNYDRDSLTEAVKAVQRGEMSVHRAGSYYGVPHSTLEYKVKERHLMRPRKREPKPQPLDGGGNSGSTSSTSNSKHSNIPGLTAVNNIDKLKSSVGHQQQKSIMKPNPTSAFPNTSPNGMKVPIFDPALTAQLQYSPHLFWQHSAAAAAGFSALPMEFSPTGRTTSTGPGNGSSGNSTATSPGLQPNPFSPNTDSFLATQMMQRFHEESRLNAAASNNSKSPSLNSSNANINNNSSNNLNNNNNLTNVPGKTAREIAQSLYESGTQNGSFLDDIIRQTLDRKSNNDIPHGALFDQLIKNTKPPLSSSTLGGSTPSSSSSSSEIHSHALVNALTSNNKRSASPNSYPVINIKRERSSSPQQQQQQPPLTSSSLLSSIGNNLREHDLRNHSKRISINDDNDSTTNTKLIRDSTSAAESLIKARLEGIMIKTEQQTNEHHITSDSISQRHHTNTSTSSSSDFNKNNTNNSTGPVNISHSIILEDLNGSNNGEGSTGSGIRTDNELINKDNRGAVTANNIISSDDLILKSKLGLIKSETDENL